MINQFDDRSLSLLDIAGFDKPKSVDTFADLPPANENLDEKYFVNKDTGVYLINKKYAGIYISNGTTWDLLEAGAFSDFDNKYVLQNTIIAIDKGGTGATTSANARVNLGAFGGVAADLNTGSSDFAWTHTQLATNITNMDALQGTGATAYSRASTFEGVTNGPFGNQWYSILNMQHRGGSNVGANDGQNWGTLLAFGLTANTTRAAFRTKSAGSFLAWREIVTTTIGTGTANNVPKFSGAGALTGSNITDNGTTVSITTPFSVSGRQISLNGATSNLIDFNTNGVAAPTFNSRSAGTKILLYPVLSSSATDYALGIESNTLWYSVPTTGSYFKWYFGTSNLATLNNTSFTAPSFIKTGGTSSQFLKADGSVDNSVYYLASNTNNYIPLTALSSTATGLTYTNTTGVFSLTSGYAIPTTASQSNWDTAYTQTRQWDGGATGLVPATGRTSLGATTTGSNLFTLTNPSAISFLRINADNSVSALNQTDFQTAIGASASATANTLVLRDGAGSFVATNGVFSGQMLLNRAWDAALFKGQIFLGGTTGNRIDWTPAGLAAPATTTRSVGTKLNFYPSLSSVNVDYAVGLETDNMWYSVPSTTQGFKWYFGTSNLATLTSSGLVCGSFSTGGTSSQFLKADGSVDATSYLPLTGGTMSGAITFAGNQTWPTWSITQGGTGAQNVSDARANLGLGTSAVLNAGVSNGVATLDGSGTIPLSQIPSNLQGALQYIGTWNAASNNPILTSSVGTKGFYYVVNFAGSTTLNGINDWKINDWAIFNGSVWEKIDNTDSVVSVNGFNGTVNLTTTNIDEGTNAYYTDIRARNSISSSATGLTYTNSTGAFTLTSGYAIPTTASQSNWDTAYNNRITSLTTTGNSGAATLISNVLNIPNYASGLPLTGGTLTGDLFLSVTGSSTASPRTIGMSNFNTGTAARFQFGDPLNSIQVSYGGRMSMQSYWGLEIYGGRQNGTTPLGFTSGATTDASLLVAGTVISNPVLITIGASGQTGDLQQWRNSSGTVLSYVTSAGVIGGSEINSFNAGTTTTSAANIRLTNNNGNGGGLALFGGSYTTSGVKRAGGTYIYSNQGGGLTLNAEGNNSLYLATNSNTALTINGSRTPTFTSDVSTTAPTIFLNQGSNPYSFIATADQYHGIILRGVPAAATTYGVTMGDQMSFVEFGGIFNFYKKNTTELTLQATINNGNLTTTGDIICGANKIIRQNQNYTSSSPTLQVGDASYGFSALSSILYFYSGTSGFRFRNNARNADIVSIDNSGNITANSFVGTASNSNQLNGISAVNLFNSMGEAHAIRTSFDATTPSYDFGFRYVTGNTNGPGTGGAQYYSLYIGLGSNYSSTGANSYGMYMAVDRNVARPYLSIRYNENNSLGTWRKIASGYSDVAGTFEGGSQLISTRANNNATGGGQIYLNGTTGNRIDFASVGYAPPSTGTRSVGTKIVLWPQVSATDTDYALGIDNATMWFSVPTTSSYFKWYASTTLLATLNGSGTFSAKGIDAQNGNFSTGGNYYGGGKIHIGYQGDFGDGTINVIPQNSPINSPINKFLDFSYISNNTFIQVGSISRNGNNTVYNTVSDYRLKENIKPIENASQKVLQLKPCNFNFKTDKEAIDGFIAHELQEVVPYAVTGKKDAINEDGTINTQQIDPSKIIALLTASLQDALKRIENLEKLIDKQNEKT